MLGICETTENLWIPVFHALSAEDPPVSGHSSTEIYLILRILPPLLLSGSFGPDLINFLATCMHCMSRPGVFDMATWSIAMCSTASQAFPLQPLGERHHATRWAYAAVRVGFEALYATSSLVYDWKREDLMFPKVRLGLGLQFYTYHSIRPCAKTS